MNIDQLPDDSQLRIVSSFPALSVDMAEALLSSLDKLFGQFQVEGRCDSYALAIEGQRSFCLMAWYGPALSGCSHDKIGKVLALFEGRASVQLLAPPPIVAEINGINQYYTHAAFKSAVSAGEVTDTTIMWDTLANSLGSWRQSGKRPLHDHWAFPLYQRSLA